MSEEIKKEEEVTKGTTKKEIAKKPTGSTSKYASKSTSKSTSSTQDKKDNKPANKGFELVNNTEEVISILNRVNGSFEQVNIAPRSSTKVKELDFNNYVSNLVNKNDLSINKI